MSQLGTWHEKECYQVSSLYGIEFYVLALDDSSQHGVGMVVKFIEDKHDISASFFAAE